MSITKMASMCGTVSVAQRVGGPARANGKESLDLRNARSVVSFKRNWAPQNPKCMVAPHPNPMENAIIRSGRLIVVLSAHEIGVELLPGGLDVAKTSGYCL